MAAGEWFGKSKDVVDGSVAGARADDVGAGGAISGAAGLMFYERLFIVDPGVRPLFRTEMHSRKPMQVIAVAVAGLDRLEQIVLAVRALGRRRADYGVREGHYETVGAALL